MNRNELEETLRAITDKVFVGEKPNGGFVILCAQEDEVAVVDSLAIILPDVEFDSNIYAIGAEAWGK